MSSVFVTFLRNIFIDFLAIVSYNELKGKEVKKMLKYKINIADALERKGFNTYKAKTTKILSQDTLKKIKNEDTNISLESINRICIILDLQPKDLLEYVEDATEIEKYKY